MQTDNPNILDDVSVKAVHNATINIDTAEGIVEAFAAAIGNKDSVGDVIIPGAFAKSLARRKPRVVWGHDWNSPIGKVLEIEEIPPHDKRISDKMRAAGVGGLYVKVQFNLGSERGKQAFSDVMFYGHEQEWSIGYKTLRKTYDSDIQANILQEVELYEVSPVLHGANNLTSTLSVKGETTSTTAPSAGVTISNDYSANADTTASGWTGGWTTNTPSHDFGIKDYMGSARPPMMPMPAPMTPEMKLRKAVSSAFGPLENMRFVNASQIVFDKPDGHTWMVKYRVEGPKLVVTPPAKVNVRTVVTPVVEMSEPMLMPEPNMIRKGPMGAPMDEYKEVGGGCGGDCDCGGKSLEEKAGRVISQGNMTKLMKASEMLSEVVASGTRMTTMMEKKDGESLADAYKAASAESDVIVVKGETLSGKIVRLTSKDEQPTMEKVMGLLDILIPKSDEFGWTLVGPSQKNLDEGTCSLGIHLSTDENIEEQVKALSTAIKSADCNVKVEVERQSFYGLGVKTFDEVFPTK